LGIILPWININHSSSDLAAKHKEKQKLYAKIINICCIFKLFEYKKTHRHLERKLKPRHAGLFYLIYAFFFICIDAMPSSIAIMILGNATANNSSQTALQFVKTVLKTGRKIERLFFYHEGASLASSLSVQSQDEINLCSEWQQFIEEHQLDAVVCIASGLKRGILDHSEARRHEKNATSLHPALELSGLGQWIDAVSKADKYIVFGN
jgi:tRNA 2-thiouridine synthesizing protein D